MGVQVDAAVFRAVPEELFEHPDRTASLDSLQDPIRSVAELQRLGPLVKAEGFDGGRMFRIGGIEFPNLAAPPELVERSCFAALTWEAGRTVYTDPSRFSSKANAASSGTHWGRNLSEMDPPEHTKYRAIVQRGFMPKQIATWGDTIVKPILERHFFALLGKGRADLVRELNVYFPYEVAGTLAGFDPADIAFVASNLHKMHQGFVNPGAALEASAALKSYAFKLIDERRREPRDDMVSALVQAEIDGEPIDDGTFVGMVIHLLQGGIDTVYRLSSTVISLMLDHPDQMAKVKADRALIPNLIEESLRFEGVASAMARQVVDDTEVMGVHMPKDSIVFLMHPSINRDPARWDNPHVFDVERPKIGHMAFGNGPHACIGMHLARFEIGHYIGLILDHMTNLRWDPDVVERPRINGWTIRGINSLPVVWDV